MSYSSPFSTKSVILQINALIFDAFFDAFNIHIVYLLYCDVQQQLCHHGYDCQYEKSSQRINGPHYREGETQ